MNKGDKATAGARSRLFIDQTRSCFLHFPERFAYVPDLNGDVMNARPALVEKPGNRRVGRRRLEQLNPRFANRQHRHADFLLGYFFNAFDLETQRLSIEVSHFRDPVRGNANMIDFH